MTELKVSVTFRHTRATPSLKRYAEEKLQKVGKYLYHSPGAHVVLSVDSKKRHQAEVTLTGRRLAVHGREEAENLYSAIDLVVDKIQHQIVKYKTRRQRRKTKA
jgi:putative sigma-54 modulation protein